MPKHFLKALVCVFAVTFLFGCSSTRNVTVRAYMQDRERVDQDVQGALGNWENSAVVEDIDSKESRKVYVLEFTKELTEADTKVVEESTSSYKSQSPADYKEPLKATQQTITSPRATMPSIPSFEDEAQTTGSVSQPVVPSTSSGATSYVDYKVEKDDTLQKISKKFYDSYSKWPKIYEANRAKIKNPDAIQPGIVIRIPIE